MEQRAVSVFDTCLEQALHEAEPLMAAMCNAALASLGAQLSSYSNAEDQQLLLHAQSQLTSKKALALCSTARWKRFSALVAARRFWLVMTWAN